MFHFKLKCDPQNPHGTSMTRRKGSLKRCFTYNPPGVTKIGYSSRVSGSHFVFEIVFT